MEQELRAAALLSRLTPEQMTRVIEHARHIHLDEGEWLFGQDDPAERFYFVRGGRLRLFRLSPDGEEKVIELVGPGETFAEALMFMGTGRYPVCAAALCESQLIAIDATDFAEMLRDSIETCFLLLGTLSQRLHGLVGEIDDLALHSATGRVVRWLLEQVPPEGLTLEVRKRVLASRLSVKPETFSRIVKRLVDDGIIAIDGRRVQIRDRTALLARCEHACPRE